MADISPSAVLPCGLLALLYVVGCGNSPVMPHAERADTVHIPGDVPPLAEFESGDVVLGRLVYTPCSPPLGGWRMNWLPDDEPLILDLYYSNQPPNEPFAGILPQNLEEIEQAGAEIITIGALGVVRVRVRRQSLIWLTPHMSRVVPREDRMDTAVFVGYEDPEVRVFFEGLGGVIVYDFSAIRALAGVVSNAAIPALERHVGVAYVEHDGFMCRL